MSVALPFSVPTSAGWQLADTKWVRRRSAAAAGGVATIDVGQLGSEEMWLLDHAVVQCTSSASTRLRLYETVVDPLQLLDGSDKGNFDVADWPAGLLLSPGTSLVAQWTGAAAGAVAALTLQVRVLRRVTG
jgi:hypothetical protein